MSEDPVDYRFYGTDVVGQEPWAKIYLPSSVHPSVIIGTESIIWRYTTIREGVIIGTDCVIAAGCLISRFCRIGDHTCLQDGAKLPDGAIVGDYVYIGPNVVLASVKYPNRRHRDLEEHRPPIIEDDAVIGANAVIQPGVVIHAGAVVGAGSVVTRDVKAGTVVAGNPARVLLKARRLAEGLHESGEVVHG